jgi:hypothetical protein
VHRVLLLLFALLWATPAAAQYGLRIKIDRYQRATLPEVKLWVTVLDGTRPVDASVFDGFSVFADGRLAEEATYASFDALGVPSAVALVVEAPDPVYWSALTDGLAKGFRDLPKGSLVFGMASGVHDVRLPERDWSADAAALPATMAAEVSARPADDTRLRQTIRAALESFPLAPGLEAEPNDRLPPPYQGEDPFPFDRVLYVVAHRSLVPADARDRPVPVLRHLVDLARRRGVRIMAVGVVPFDPSDPAALEAGEVDEVDDPSRDLSVLARKTGGTYRGVTSFDDVGRAMTEAHDELLNRVVVTAEAPSLRRGDRAWFAVRARARGRAPINAREFPARIENELSWFGRALDWISDTWEKWPWWARTLVIAVGALLVIALVLVVMIKKSRKRRKARDAEAKARAAKLDARAPCAVCGNMMMPEWTECLFCAQAAAAQRPMRFRLVGRNGDYTGRALRFDKELVVLGSEAHCDVRVIDRGVAPEHCGLRDRGNDEFVLSDFNTDAGTWVNGQRVAQVQVHEGDLIRVGDTEFIFGIEA